MSNEDEEARGVDEVVGALQELVLMDPGFAAMQDNLFRKYAGRGGTRQRERRVVVDGRRDRSTTAFCLYVCMQRCSTMMTGTGPVRTSCATWRHSETTHRLQARAAASPSPSIDTKPAASRAPHAVCVCRGLVVVFRAVHRGAHGAALQGGERGLMTHPPPRSRPPWHGGPLAAGSLMRDGWLCCGVACPPRASAWVRWRLPSCADRRRPVRPALRQTLTKGAGGRPIGRLWLLRLPNRLLLLPVLRAGWVGGQRRRARGVARCARCCWA